MAYNVTDSSLSIRSNLVSTMDSAIDDSIKVGMVREIITSSDKQIRYMVEVSIRNTVILVPCHVMVQSGSPYDYEEVKYRTYRQAGLNPPVDPFPYTDYKTKSGDMVIVALIQGSARAGVILGALLHPSRAAEITADKKGYIKTYNGIETKITDDGEYRVTFKGKLLNPLDLHIPGTPILPAQYDPVSGGSFLSIDNTGSITLNDNVSQSIKIDKTGKATTITAGKSIAEFGPSGYSLTAPKIAMESKLASEIKALSISLEATKDIKIKGTKVAIGNSSFELIDGLIKLIDALGALTVISPNGPCNPLQGAATWAQVAMIKSQLSVLKGSL